MKLLLPMILQLAGIGVIIAEILIPSAGILGLTAGGLIIYSVYLVFTSISPTAGYLFIAADVILIPATIAIGIKLMALSPATLSRDLSSKSGVTSQSAELQSLIGKTGTALSNLRPSGTALVDGKRLDVVSRGEYLEKTSEIVILAVTGNQVVVGKNKGSS